MLINIDNCEGMDMKLCQLAEENNLTDEQFRYFTKGWQALWGMIIELPSADRPHVGYTGVDEDYLVSVQEVLNITAETGALETQRRVRELARRDRPQGEWIFKTIFPNDKSEFPMGYLVCSVCGSHHSNSTPCNYCDNCGAKMK